jgi:glycosyltransferase involved in cell wall biosynthesis
MGKSRPHPSQPDAPGQPRPARVVMLLQNLKFGGTQRQALELACHLDRSRFQVEVWLMAAGDDMVPVARDLGVPLVWLSRQDVVGPRAILNLWVRLYRQPPDILLTLTSVPNIWGRILGRLAGVPIIVGNCRGGTPHRQHEQWLWPLADHLLCNAAALKEELTRRYRIPAARITVIPNGVDTVFFRPEEVVPPPDPQVILSVARLVPDKDHGTLISAFRLVSEAYPEAKLWLAGDGPQQEAIERQVRLLPPGRVRLWPGQTDIRPLLHRASLLVLSSCHEGLPNVVLEAMAAGLPVVATQVGGLPEVVVPGRTGWLVPPRDVNALAAAMAHLLGDGASRQSFGRAGRERAERQYSIAAMVRGHEEVLQYLVNAKRC